MAYLTSNHGIGDYVSIDDGDVKGRITIIKFGSSNETYTALVLYTVEWWHEGNLIVKDIEEFRLKAWDDAPKMQPISGASKDPETDTIPF